MSLIKPDLYEGLRTFNQINKEINDIYHEKIRKEKMSNSEFDILYSLCELGEGCTQRDICGVSWLPKQTVNSAIQKLEKEGFLTLVAGKGRQRLIQLTEKGKKVIETKIFPIIAAENKAFEELNETECKKMLQCFENYCKILRNYMEE